MRAVSADAKVEIDVIGEVAGLIPRADNGLRDTVMAMTGENSADLVPFGTEAGLFQDMGMDVIVCGPGSIEQAHKPDEYISRDQLQACLKLLDALGLHMTTP